MIYGQNNLKESYVFRKLALEIEPGNASHIRSEFRLVYVNPSLAMHSLLGLKIISQSLEDKDEFVGTNEDASDFLEDSNGFGLGFMEYRHMSPSCSPVNSEVKWPVCKKYPECPICIIDIEQPGTQRVSQQSRTQAVSLGILLRITRI